MDAALTQAYYRPGGYGGPAQLRQELKTKGITVSLQQVRDWLRTQELGQLTTRQPKPTQQNHYAITQGNVLHQCDLMFIFPDGPYRYILCLVDCATRWKEARPLRTKQAAEVAKALQCIYDEGPLEWPKMCQTDAGSEFKGAVEQLYESHGTSVRHSDAGAHTQQAFVENMNRWLGLRIFKAAQAKELIAGEPQPPTWVKDLPKILDSMNNTVTALIGMPPAKAVELGEVPERKVSKKQLAAQKPPPPLLPQNVRVRVRIQADQQEGGRQRATDWQWSKQIYRIDHAVYNPSGAKPTLYYIAGFQHGIQRADLLVVPPPQPPPAAVAPAAAAAAAHQWEVIPCWAVRSGAVGQQAQEGPHRVRGKVEGLPI